MRHGSFGAMGVGSGGGGSSSPPYYRSSTTLGYASHTNTVLTLPTGVVAGDILIAHIFLYGSATITPPAGWSPVEGSAPYTYAPSYQLYAYWKKAGASEPSTYTFTHTASNTSGAIMAIGGSTAASPIDAYQHNGSTAGTTGSLTGITTSVPNTLLVVVESNNDGNTVYVTGFTNEYHVTLCDGLTKVQAAAGATGTISITNTGNSTASQWGAILFAIKP